jgi:hypothetical protein
MVNADLRSAEVIKRVGEIHMPCVAEIGVYKGDMARRLLIHPNLVLTMVDPWGEVVSDTYKASGDEYALHTPEEWEAVKEKALSGVSWAKDRVRVYQGTSEGAADYFSDDKFDLVFIDGDHSYAGVRNDYTDALRYLSPGGMMVFHDIVSSGAPGVAHFWGEAKGLHRHVEIVHSDTCGIGVIYP